MPAYSCVAFINGFLTIGKKPEGIMWPVCEDKMYYMPTAKAERFINQRRRIHVLKTVDVSGFSFKD